MYACERERGVETERARKSEKERERKTKRDNERDPERKRGLRERERDYSMMNEGCLNYRSRLQKSPIKKDHILQKRPISLSILLKMAMVNRIDCITGLFCRISSLL